MWLLKQRRGPVAIDEQRRRMAGPQHLRPRERARAVDVQHAGCGHPHQVVGQDEQVQPAHRLCGRVTLAGVDAQALAELVDLGGGLDAVAGYVAHDQPEPIWRELRERANAARAGSRGLRRRHP